MTRAIAILAITLLAAPSLAEATTYSLVLGARGGVAIQKDIESQREMRTRHVVVQKYDYSCGSAAIATLLKYHGDPVSEEEVIDDILQTGDIEKIIIRRGFSLLDLKRYVESRGYEAWGYRAGLEDLMGLDFPVLMPISVNNYKHFVLFLGVRGSRVYLADPSAGIVTMPIYQFKAYWFENVFLVISKQGARGLEFEEIGVTYMDDIWNSIRNNAVSAPQNPVFYQTY